MLQWNQKSQPEMDVNSQKLTGSPSKIQSDPNIPPAKARQLSNNNDYTNKRESLLVQSIAVTTGVGVTKKHPIKTCFESR